MRYCRSLFFFAFSNLRYCGPRLRSCFNDFPEWQCCSAGFTSGFSYFFHFSRIAILWCWNDPRSPPFGKFRTLGGLGGLESLGGLRGLGSLGGLGGRETQICDTVVRSELGGLKSAILSITFVSHFPNCDTVLLESGRVLTIFHNCDTVVLDSHQNFLIFSTFPELRYCGAGMIPDFLLLVSLGPWAAWAAWRAWAALAASAAWVAWGA